MPNEQQPVTPGSESTPPQQPTNTVTNPEAHLGDPGKRALDAERTRAEAAERDAAALRAEIKKRDDDAAAAAAKEAEEQGKWEELAKERETNLATATQERDTAVSERDALRTYFEAEYKTAVKDLPEVITAFKPADDAPFAEKSAWLTKAKAEAAKVTASTPGGGNPPNPPVSGGQFDLQAETAKAASQGKYSL